MAALSPIVEACASVWEYHPKEEEEILLLGVLVYKKKT